MKKIITLADAKKYIKDNNIKFEFPDPRTYYHMSIDSLNYLLTVFNVGSTDYKLVQYAIKHK